MHELLLSSVIKEHEVPKILALLGGFTEMHERHQFTRVQHFEPSPAVKGISTIKELQKERHANASHWNELHQILTKQPCTIQVRTRLTDSEVEGAKKGWVFFQERTCSQSTANSMTFHKQRSSEHSC